MNRVIAARLMRAGYRQGYAQGRADAGEDIEAACQALPTTVPAVQRLMVAAARGIPSERDKR